VEYFKAARPHKGILAVLLALASFRLAHTNQLAYIAMVSIVIFAIVSATMIWNDYCDRDQDAAKGKRAAYENPEGYRKWSVRLWAISISLSLGLLAFSWQSFVLAVSIAAVGWLYSTAIIRVQFLPALSVAALCTVVIFFPACLPGGYVAAQSKLALLTFLMILAREVMSDIGDSRIDAGHKATIAVAFGVEAASICVFIVMIITIVGSMTVRSGIGLFCYLCVRDCLVRFQRDGYEEGRFSLDIITLLVLLSVLALGEF
jgi:4-hydroxybenzoate polyprenyltransferase